MKSLSLKVILGAFTCSASFCDEISLFMPVPASGTDFALETRSKFYDHLNRFLDWLMGSQNLQYEIGILNKKIAPSPLCLVDFEKKHGFFSHERPLVGQYTPSKEDIFYTESILDRIDQENLNPHDRLFYIQEVLSKVLAYRQLDEGDKVLIPDFEEPGQSSIYTVDKVFQLGMGTPGFALTTQDDSKPSILLYRGTRLAIKDKSGLASIVADLDLYGPGYTAFFKSEEPIKQFLLEEKEKNKNVAVLGYSLGGALTVYTSIFFPDLIDHAQSAAFNPPGVQKKLLNLCLNHGAAENMPVYVNQHDPVSKWGFLVGKIQILSGLDRMGPLEAHTTFMSSQAQLDFFECDLDVENQRHRYFFIPE